MASAENKEVSDETTPKEITSEGNDSELSGDTDSEYSISCDPCNKTFSGYIPYKQHMESQQHQKQLNREKALKKLKKKIPETCNLKTCNDPNEDDSFIPEITAECTQCKKMFYNVISYNQHLESKKHKTKLKELELIEKLKRNDIAVLPKQGNSDNSAGNDIPLDEKLLQKFKKEVSTNESSEDDDSDDVYTCKDCKKAFSGVKPYFQHILSPAHEKKLKQIKFMKKYLREKEKEASSSESENSDSNNEIPESQVADIDAAPSRNNALKEDLNARSAQEDVEFKNDTYEEKNSKSKKNIMAVAKESYKAMKDTLRD